MRSLWIVTIALTLSSSAWSQGPKTAGKPAAPRPQVVLETGGHTAPVTNLFFTADSKELITVSSDGSIRGWDVEAGELKRVLRPVATNAPAFSPAFSPDRKTLALSDGHNILFLNVKDGRIRSVPSGANAWVGALAFDADGKRLAGGTTGHEAFVLDVATGKRLHTFKTEDHVNTCVGFSPDGQRLTAFTEGPEVLNLVTRKPETYRMAASRCFAWSPDSHILAVGSTFSGWYGIRYYDTGTKKEIKHFPVGSTTSITFLPGGKELLTTGTLPKESKSRVNILDARTGKELMRFTSPVPYGPHAEHADLSPDGRLVASAGGPGHFVYVWRRSDGKLLHTFRGKGISFTAGAWRKDGKAIAWGWQYLPGKVGRQPLLNAFDLTELRFLGKPDPKDYRRAVWKEGGTSLVLDTKKTVIRDGKNLHLRTYSSPRGGDLVGTLLPSNRVAIGSETHLFLYDLNAGADFDKQNNRFMLSSEPCAGTNDNLADIAPSPDNKYVLTASRDQILRIWRVEPKRLALHLSLFVAGREWIAWTPEGYYAATPGGERLMGWTVNNGRNRLMTFYPADRFRKQLYRPDVIKLVVDKGSLRKAVAAANAARKKEGQAVAAPVANVEELLPPTVALQVVDQKGAKVTLKASATAAVANQPVDALRLLLDGRPLPEVGNGRFVTPKAKAEEEWTVEVPPGEHQLAVLARSPDASAVSRGIKVVFVKPAALPLLHVLTVGVSDYQDKALKLAFAAKDAQDSVVALQKACKGPLFRDVQARALVDAEANRGNVLKAVAQLRKDVKPNDLVVVFFAGHGVKVKERFYLLTVEAQTDDLPHTTLTGDDLRKSLGEFPCQVLLLLDACHSAGSLVSFRPAVDAATRILTEDECGVAVMCSAMGSEKALERDGNGLFTLAVIQGLTQADGVPFNRRDRRQYLHHLQAFVFDEVKEQSRDQQHPVLNLPWAVQSFALRQLSPR